MALSVTCTGRLYQGATAGTGGSSGTNQLRGTAFDYLRKARDTDANDRDVRLKLGTIYLLARHVPEAEAEAAFILERDPRDLDAALLAASASDTPAKLDESIRRLEALGAVHGNRARLHIGLGTLYARKGDAAATERAFKEAIYG